MATLKLDVTGMSCGHCVAAVRSALEALDGVQVRAVEIGSTEVEYDASRVSVDQIVSAVEDEGYNASANVP